jgi:predicted O-linked N-acetylglucosamine transferase (SPINDLY family)
MSADVVRNINPHSRTRRSGETAQDVDFVAGSMPNLPQQYALPIHHSNWRGDSSDGTDSGEHTPRGENTLRRKTPNGTLNAGYEGSASDSNPQKHQLVPLTEPYGQLPQHISVPPKRTFLQHQQRQNNGLNSGWNTPPTPIWQGSQYPLPQNAFPVMDSMLNQMPIHTYNAQQYFGQTVPSVIQPSFQYLGPTASGVQGSGPYGPYWHDGTFVPYRPAAVRDPRFYHHPSMNWSAPLVSTPFALQSSAWPQTPFVTQWPQLHAGLPVENQMPSYNSTPIPSGYSVNSHNDYTSVPQAQYGNHTGFIQHNNVPQPSNMAHGAMSSDYFGVSAVEGEFGASSPKGRQRDKTFAWALQQYRELLAFIQHTRRQQQQNRQMNGQSHIAQRPSFYPKPPKASPAGSSLNLNKTRQSVNDRPTDSLHRADSAPEHESVNSDNELEAHRNRTSSLQTPTSIQPNDGEYHRRASYDQYSRPQQWPQPIQHHADKFRTLRRSSGSSVSNVVSPTAVDESPTSKAQFALSVLTQICQEADWRWTDGMHLGGCLAYGLGDFQKALRWYTKVLKMDPKHLEATSNLAATLLALGRKEEAESNWKRVVKAAPNHFEAVEHLIGMLCTDQRSEEAIKVIEYVELSLRQSKPSDSLKVNDRQSECSSSNASRSPCISEMSDKMAYDFDADGESFSPDWRDTPGSNEPGFGSSGFAIPGCDNGRILALIHAKGNMLYSLGDNAGAARAFEDAVLIAAGRKFGGIRALVSHILAVVASSLQQQIPQHALKASLSSEPILLSPEQALATAKLCFPWMGELPGLQHLPGGPQSIAKRAVVSTTSNSLLSLAKIFQDGMSNTQRAAGVAPLASGVRDILALYYLSLSLQPSPSTANNVGILLASVQQTVAPNATHQKLDIPGVVPGSGIALALQYYNYGLQLDSSHAHLYTNLGSLLKDIGQLDAAIKMYERAVYCDGKFDIALANLANAVKDKGRINDAIVYYRRAVEVSPDFAEAVCGLANALNSVCAWHARGGIAEDHGKRDRWHVDPQGMLLDARQAGATSSGWVKRVLDIVGKQLFEGEAWGRGTLTPTIIELLVQQLTILEGSVEDLEQRESDMRKTLTKWAGKPWEGVRIGRLVERATRRIGWHWYQDLYVKKKPRTSASYNRPQLPSSLSIPAAPTVLPFHTFTCPMSAKQIRLISQRNGLRISISTLRSPWLSKQVSPPPKPPAPQIRVGYISSDFNNHPLAHLMQSVFGMHNTKRITAYCYATTAGDNSVHRQQIESEAPHFRDVSSWTTEKIVNQIVKDGIHILVNLNGYTRGARNEVFAARPAPIQMSFMGFAGTLGAEWCDYLLADETAVPPETLRPWRRNIDLEDQMVDENIGGDDDSWVYGENIIYCRDTFFCCDHKQSAPDAQDKRLSWSDEQKRRWKMRKELFPQISDDTIIFGNFNQLYKVCRIKHSPL